MKGERRSAAAEEKHLRWKEEEEEGWRCRKHPFQPRYGVCPACLRDSLLRLCPECANARPSCACAPFSSSSSSASSSSSSSFSCLSFPADLPRSGATGPTGGASSLIEREPPFQRRVATEKLQGAGNVVAKQHKEQNFGCYDKCRTKP